MSEHNRMTEYAPEEIPTQVKCKLYIGYGIGKWNAGRIVIADNAGSRSEEFATVAIMEKEITFDLPKCKIDIKGKMLEVLQEEKQKVLAENHARLQAVQEKIDRFLVIEYQTEA